MFRKGSSNRAWQVLQWQVYPKTEVSVSCSLYLVLCTLMCRPEPPSNLRSGLGEALKVPSRQYKNTSTIQRSCTDHRLLTLTSSQNASHCSHRRWTSWHKHARIHATLAAEVAASSPRFAISLRKRAQRSQLSETLNRSRFGATLSEKLRLSAFVPTEAHAETPASCSNAGIPFG